MIDPVALRKLVAAALAEDIGAGDITSLVVDERKKGSGVFIARENFVLCGTAVAALCFSEFDSRTSVAFSRCDGAVVRKGARFGAVRGSLRSLLAAERVALNFLQRLSGIATVTRDVARIAGKYGVIVLDTRKTTPLLRGVEKYAVTVGGGRNHRFGLADGILIKDNHIAAAGGITAAVARARAVRPALVRIEVEVTTFDELDEALRAGAEQIMLDNMSPPDVCRAVKFVKGRALVEVSGGITPDNIAAYAACRPDFISLGFITHSARAVDISLEIE